MVYENDQQIARPTASKPLNSGISCGPGAGQERVENRDSRRSVHLLSADLTARVRVKGVEE